LLDLWTKLCERQNSLHINRLQLGPIYFS